MYNVWLNGKKLDLPSVTFTLVITTYDMSIFKKDPDFTPNEQDKKS